MITDDAFRATVLSVAGVSAVIGTALAPYSGFAPNTGMPCAQYTRAAGAQATHLTGASAARDARYDLFFFADARADAWAAANALETAKNTWGGTVTVGAENATVMGMFLKDTAEIPVQDQDGNETGIYAVRQQWRFWINV